MYSGRGFNEIKEGHQFINVMTMTETHIVLGAGLFGDFNPLHTNQTFGEQSRFGGRIAHGYLTNSCMAAAMGVIFHGTAIAYLEQNCRFIAPVRIGDTLTTTWTVTSKDEKPKQNGGVVALAGTCANQDGVTVAEANAKLLVANNDRRREPRDQTEA